MNEVKFGLILPSSNTTMEPEFWKMVSGWGTVHSARVRLRDITRRDLEKMEEKTADASRQLCDADVDIIGYGCTSGSLFRGGDHFLQIEKTITAETGIPSVATAGAVLEALHKLDVNNICVATPYTDEINSLEQKFLQEHDITVHAIKGLNIVDNIEVGRTRPQLAYDLAREVYRHDADGLFISCTNFRTLEIIDRLEKALRLPVISSNTATLWAMMKKLGIEKRIKGFGDIFLINYS